MTVLSTLSGDLASLVESAGKVVVQVDGRRGGAASGVVWTRSDLVVTANHVLTRDEDILVGMGNGKSVEATLVGRDPTTDLALLRLEDATGSSPDWTAIDGLRVGHLVLGLGRPGRSVRAVLGIVSALGGSWRTSAGGVIDNYVQTDASSPPGFSGGPLINADGRVLGLMSSALLRGTTVAVPSTTVRAVVDELLARGRVARGYLGVGIQPVRLPPDVARQAGQETGLLIISVDPGSPGERAGLVMGDTILAVGEMGVRHLDDLLASLGKDLIGETVPVRVLRAGSLQEVKAVIGERP
jgi:S1-C subfamily serine protease